MSVESDLLAMLEGWDSQEVTLGDFTGRGLLDQMDVVDADRGGDPVLVRKTVLRLRRSDFLDANGACTVSRGDTVTVDEIAYSVTDVRMGSADGRSGEEIDGRELHLVVRKV